MSVRVRSVMGNGTVYVYLLDDQGNILAQETTTFTGTNEARNVSLSFTVPYTGVGTHVWQVVVGDLENIYALYNVDANILPIIGVPAVYRGITVVSIPSMTDIALFDSLATGIMVITMLVLLLLFNKREYLLLVVSISIIILSTVFMTSRSIVPVGYRIENQTVIYTYDRNPYSMLYLAPLGLGIFGVALFVLRLIYKTFRINTGSRGTRYRWGR